MVIDAVWVVLTRQVIVTFDMDMLNVALDLTNWKLTYDGGTKLPTEATVTGPEIALRFGPSPGASLIAYAPPPFDVVAAPPNGQPAAAFAWGL